MELKPCPFCGGVASKWYHGTIRGDYIGFIKCNICGCTSKVKTLGMEPPDGAPEKDPAWDAFWEQDPFMQVQYMWNRRVNNGNS